jgi:hypothetical protein
LSSIEKKIQEKYLDQETSKTVKDIENYPVVILGKAFLPDALPIKILNFA